MTETNERAAYERAFRDAYEIVDDSASPSEALLRLEEVIQKGHPMNDEQRAALEKELIWVLMPYTDTEFQAGLAVMTIIDRLLAERDIDAMLNAVHGFPSIKVWEIDYLHGTIGYACEIDNTVGHPTATGTGPTRVAAIADACRKAKAKEVQHGTD